MALRHARQSRKLTVLSSYDVCLTNKTSKTQETNREKTVDYHRPKNKRGTYNNRFLSYYLFFLFIFSLPSFPCLTGHLSIANYVRPTSNLKGTLRKRRVPYGPKA